MLQLPHTIFAKIKADVITDIEKNTVDYESANFEKRLIPLSFSKPKMWWEIIKIMFKYRSYNEIYHFISSFLPFMQFAGTELTLLLKWLVMAKEQKLLETTCFS